MTGGEVLGELHIIDHRHGEQRQFVLRLTPSHLTLVSLDQGDGAHQEGVGRLLGGLRAMFGGAKGPMTPHPILDTEFRLDDNGVRIRMGTNATYSFADFDPNQARRFLTAYLQAKGKALGKA